MSRKLIRIGLLMTFASVMSGALGYLFQVLMGRMLTTQDFALFAAIMSVAAIITSPISAVFVVVSRNITQAFVGYSGFFVSKTYKKFGLACLFVTMSLVIVATSLGAEIGVYIKNSNTIQVLLLAIVIGSTSIGLLNNAYLQGAQKYSWLAGSGFITASLKIMLSVTFVWFGLGVNGALLGTIVSTMLVNFVLMLFLQRSYAGLEPIGFGIVEKSIFNFQRLLPVLVANFSIAVMTQLDVVLVNNFFDFEEAGRYAAASILGKAILFLPCGLIVALFPMVAEAQANGSRVVNYIFSASGLTAAMCLAGVLIYWFAGREIILILFGDKYLGAEEILKYYSLAMLPLALLIVAENFLMALGKVVYAWLSLIFAPLQVGLIYFNHDSVFDVITIVGFCGVALLLFGYCFLYKNLSVKKV